MLREIVTGLEAVLAAWFVDLAALAAPTCGYPALVPQAGARSLRVPETPGAPLTETLQEAPGARQLQLVLDNCEHRIDACARLANALLSTSPPDLQPYCRMAYGKLPGS